MSNLDYFKKQAKNFLKDWKTYLNSNESSDYHPYKWKFFDIPDLFLYFELDEKDEQDICLSRAQHYIAKIVGFKNWQELKNANDDELELAKFLLHKFKNSIYIEDWEHTITFVAGIKDLDAKTKLEYAKQYYENLEKELEDTEIFNSGHTFDAAYPGDVIFVDELD